MEVMLAEMGLGVEAVAEDVANAAIATAAINSRKTRAYGYRVTGNGVTHTKPITERFGFTGSMATNFGKLETTEHTHTTVLQPRPSTGSLIMINV